MRRRCSASLRYLESALGIEGSESPHHAQLIEHYRYRLRVTGEIGAAGGAWATRASHFGAAAAAVAAGRKELIRLHQSGEIHDSILRAIESELDLEELRFKQLAGEKDA